MTIHEIQELVVARIGTRPVESASRFRLMDAADAISKAIEAEEREAGAEVAGNQVESPAVIDPQGGANPEGNQP